MAESIILQAFLLVSLIGSVIENRIQVKRETLKSSRIHFTVHQIVLAIFVMFFLTLLFLVKGPKDIVLLYVYGSFGLLAIANSLWLTINSSNTLRIACILGVVVLLALRITIPSALIHNLLIIFSILWLGPLLTQLKIITKKRFVVASLFLFLYDIVYVWLTPLHSFIGETTQQITFPLGIVAGGNLLGTGDLLYANIALSLLSKKTQLLGVLVFLGSNILLDITAGITGWFSSFPLLILWVPLMLLLLMRDSQQKHG